MLTSAIAIILALGGLIFFHELGHFAVARMFRMGVKAFSLGFGPKLAGFTSGKTDYKLSLVPLGGYVALAGETGEEEDDDEFEEHELFSNRPAWQRMCVVAAGPFFNFVLAFIIYWFLALAQGQGVILPTVGGVMADSPAAAAGFQLEDRVLSIDGTPIDSWSDMVTTIRDNGDRNLEFKVLRGEEQLTLNVTPKVNTVKNLFGEEVTVPMVGISQGGKIEYHPVDGLGAMIALEHTWNMSKVVVKGFVSIIERLIPVDQIGGPIMLAQMVHSSAQSGIFDLLAMVAVISINLAIINLLPIPVLDGGHILFCGLEIIFRRPLSEKWKALAMRFGIMLLLMLMALAIFNDFRRILS
ncbi:RIP metalloprotease RseP [Pseudodesulfovibrio sp. zrk46]|uniref:RIP metalloprotease RseP n=1 Tax=Pseudodesulfovibrio sp. zrk46 TaxID=2725288 RepID=UPI001448A7B2|nr:RIP metalloprotease RseP [Pseudodesulfovibrio sp. zrk46]QJB58112.1 RIP metalloprotease RseP [Pseudodesulfovibrio sp. zrk46]